MKTLKPIFLNFLSKAERRSSSSSTIRRLKASSNQLFAKKGLFSYELERFFNKNFESIVDGHREKIAAAATDLSNFKPYKALTLLIFLQAGRIRAAKNMASDVSKIVTFSESEIDQLVLEINKKFCMVTPKQRALYRGCLAMLVSKGALDFHKSEALTSPDYTKAVQLFLNITS